MLTAKKRLFQADSAVDALGIKKLLNETKCAGRILLLFLPTNKKSAFEVSKKLYIRKKRMLRDADGQGFNTPPAHIVKAVRTMPEDAMERVVVHDATLRNDKLQSECPLITQRA
jgi:hypothetical protein